MCVCVFAQYFLNSCARAGKSQSSQARENRRAEYIYMYRTCAAVNRDAYAFHDFSDMTSLLEPSSRCSSQRGLSFFFIFRSRAQARERERVEVLSFARTDEYFHICDLNFSREEEYIYRGRETGIYFLCAPFCDLISRVDLLMLLSYCCNFYHLGYRLQRVLLLEGIYKCVLRI